MINRISASLSERIGLRLNSSDNEKEIYAYSIEVLISLLINLIILSITAYILKKQAELITFIVFFSSLRSFAGGYHAKTHIECISLSLFLFVISALSSTYFIEYGKIILFLGILFSTIMVFVFAPTESENKPLSKKKHKKYRLISRVLVTALSASAICLYFTKETTGHVYITAIIAMSFESISLLKQ
ncbi:MAG: accessory gene regulator B family protein [Tissierellia bacterium]|nr:accessory gene regulator B family protein [Tissierellia bacterium]